MEREMTIAEGLTKLKIIKKQLDTLNRKFSKYSAWNNKKKHPLGDSKTSVANTLNQAQEEINKDYQSYMDLIEEYKQIKSAIDFTNLQVTITVAGKTMTLYDALTYLRHIKPLYDSLNKSFGNAISNAEYDVDNYNSTFARVDDEQKKAVMADIIYFIDKDKIKEINDFNDQFLLEVNGKLNSQNALTQIIWPGVKES